MRSRSAQNSYQRHELVLKVRTGGGFPSSAAFTGWGFGVRGFFWGEEFGNEFVLCVCGVSVWDFEEQGGEGVVPLMPASGHRFPLGLRRGFFRGSLLLCIGPTQR